MGRHSETTRKSVDTSKKNNIKKISILIICIIVVIIIAVIINNANKKSDKTVEVNSYTAEDEVSNTLNNAFTSIKESNIDEVQKYVDYTKVIYALDAMVYQNGESNLEKSLFSAISWEIKDVNIEGFSANAVVELTNKDYKEILTKWMKIIVEEDEKGTQMSNDFALNKLYEIIDAEDNMKTITKEIRLEKQDDEWIISVDENFINLIYPGMDSLVEALNEI